MLKVKSEFKCEHDGHEITKIELLTDTNGLWTNHLYGNLRSYPSDIFPEWLQEMGEGLYIIDGFRFDVMGKWVKEIHWSNSEHELHPLRKYVVGEEIGESMFDMEDDYECSLCRGGGCPSCDTSGYFTGLEVFI